MNSVQHLSESDLIFPFAETGFCCRSLDPFTNSEHTHSFYELIYCTSSCPTHVINGKKYEFPRNSIFIISPMERHYFIDFHNAAAITICIDVKKFQTLLNFFSLENDLCFHAGNAPFFLELPTSEEPFFRNLYSRMLICDPLQRTPYLKLFLSRVLGCKLQQDLDKHPIPNDFLKAVSEMEKFKNVQKGVPAFLQLANVSHAHLCRLSNQYLHMKPHEYINKIRLQYAYTMIVEESMDYEEIAELVGFSSYPHFCKLFRETYNTSPSKLRNKKRVK